MSQVPVKWAAGNHLEDQQSLIRPIPVVPLSALREVVEVAIDAEEEMPGEIPQEMYDTIIRGDKDTVAEVLRIVVRATKKGVKQRLLAMLDGIQKQDSGSNT